MNPRDPRELPSAAAVESSCKVILLVDDEIPIQFLMWKMLRSEGFTVLTAGSGESALMTCRSYPGSIDLLLTDMEMSRMNGLELYKRVAAERPGIKAVIMSGNLGTKESAALAGLPFLEKPFLYSTVREVIETTLQDRH